MFIFLYIFFHEGDRLFLQKGISSDDASVPFKNKGESFSRVMKLSAEGYSYETITKILAKEEKERYKKLFEKEKAERLAALEAQVRIYLFIWNILIFRISNLCVNLKLSLFV